MTISIVRVDEYEVAPGDTLTYTAWSADTGLHRMYVAFQLYQSSGYGEANFVSSGWTEMTDFFNGAERADGSFSAVGARFRTTVPSTNISITVPTEDTFAVPLAEDVTILVMVLETDAAIDDVDSPYNGDYFRRPSWFPGNAGGQSDFDSDGSHGAGSWPSLNTGDGDVSAELTTWAQTFFTPYVFWKEDAAPELDFVDGAASDTAAYHVLQAGEHPLTGYWQVGALVVPVQDVYNFSASANVSETPVPRWSVSGWHGVFLSGVSVPVAPTLGPSYQITTRRVDLRELPHQVTSRMFQRD